MKTSAVAVVVLVQPFQNPSFCEYICLHSFTGRRVTLIFLLNYLLLVKLGNYGGVPVSVVLLEGPIKLYVDFRLAVCFLFVELCDFVQLGVVETRLQHPVESKMSMLHEVQRLSENKDIAANCRQMITGSVWHSQAEFFLCTLHTFFSERFVL